jgi:hypothetical protein
MSGSEIFKNFSRAVKEDCGDSKFAEVDKIMQTLVDPAYWEVLEAKVSQALIPEKPNE